MKPFSSSMQDIAISGFWPSSLAAWYLNMSLTSFSSLQVSSLRGNRRGQTRGSRYDGAQGNRAAAEHGTCKLSTFQASATLPAPVSARQQPCLPHRRFQSNPFFMHRSAHQSCCSPKSHPPHFGPQIAALRGAPKTSRITGRCAEPCSISSGWSFGEEFWRGGEGGRRADYGDRQLFDVRLRCRLH